MIVTLKHRWVKRYRKATAPIAQLLLHAPIRHGTLNKLSCHISWTGRDRNKVGFFMVLKAEKSVTLCWSFWQSHINTRQPCDRVHPAPKSMHTLMGNFKIFHKGISGFTWNLPLNSFSPNSSLIRDIHCNLRGLTQTPYFLQKNWFQQLLSKPIFDSCVI